MNRLNEGQHPAQQRLIVEELLVHRLVMIKRRDDYAEQSALGCPYPHDIVTQFFAGLPFTLTKAQRRVVQEIRDDLQQPYPMMRLLQGDVGSGKTVIAAISALSVIGNNAQVALMAPTELLAEQHYRVVKQWFEPLQIHVSLLTGRLSKRRRDVLLSELADGQIDLLVGTHALFQEDVCFKRLALMMIDEQHRFGVHQRLALKAKGMVSGYVPHQLMMTATPIPRTLAMSVYADLDCSVIDELPAGRKPIITLALDNHKRDAVIERIVNLCDQGQQVYWVCPLIEESELLQCEAAEKSAQQLAQQLPLLTVSLLHGKMKSKDKENTMRLFKDGLIHVLVATTVIEVGVDVPNASLMVIENAERLGLSQLHQLRGRVGRGSVSSYCILLYQSPLGAIARERIRVMRDTQDGFAIAEKDLELRGSGELLGTRQTGETNFRLANLVRDRYWLSEVQKIADKLWENHPEIARQMIARWLGGKEDLIGV
ncbi:MAG: ATP-dependent DNA helicase RecG [Gammaproteobacteria bacterium]|nr:ATP-dependent DNA helicase RecG [Gammaproteobacteria bacterium]